jgi:hypothetical protein
MVKARTIVPRGSSRIPAPTVHRPSRIHRRTKHRVGMASLSSNGSAATRCRRGRSGAITLRKARIPRRTKGRLPTSSTGSSVRGIRAPTQETFAGAVRRAHGSRRSSRSHCSAWGPLSIGSAPQRVMSADVRHRAQIVERAQQAPEGEHVDTWRLATPAPAPPTEQSQTPRPLHVSAGARRPAWRRPEIRRSYEISGISQRQS